MFIQVITGLATDAEGLRRQFDRWEDDLRPGAAGFLGSTAGITDDGQFVAVVRFESATAAQANSRRDEQAGWWAETEKCLEDPVFQDSVEVTTMLEGADGGAGFVQVMRGRVIDPGKMAAMEASMGEAEKAMARHRPDILGDVFALHAGDSYTDAVYFRSEAEARRREGEEMPPEIAAMFEHMMSAMSIDEYLDLKDPWLS